jgi:hypothetical protein
MMRKYNSFTPVPSSNTKSLKTSKTSPIPIRSLKLSPLSPALNQSLSEAMEHWNSNTKGKNSTSDLLEDDAKIMSKLGQERNNHLSSESEHNSDSNGVKFQLQTEAGILSYKPSDYSNYTDFLRVVIEMMLAFNSSEVDPEFKKIIHKAFEFYETGETFDDDSEDSDDESYSDSINSSLKKAREEAAQYEQGAKYISSLPKSDTLTLKILQAESEFADSSRVEKILSKLTDLPPNLMHAVVRKNEPFSLPFEKAAEIYIQLRMLGVILTVKSVDATVKKSKESPSKKTVTTKKASAAKKSVKKATAKSGRGRVVAKKTIRNKINIKPTLTGSEKLRTTVGIIQE